MSSLPIVCSQTFSLFYRNWTVFKTDSDDFTKIIHHCRYSSLSKKVARQFPLVKTIHEIICKIVLLVSGFIFILEITYPQQEVKKTRQIKRT
jgi:hypothetical protein